MFKVMRRELHERLNLIARHLLQDEAVIWKQDGRQTMIQNKPSVCFSDFLEHFDYLKMDQLPL